MRGNLPRASGDQDWYKDGTRIYPEDPGLATTQNSKGTQKSVGVPVLLQDIHCGLC